jgi:transposase
MLYHDNVPFHTSLLTQQFLAKHKMAVIPHPPYSPVLAPCEFFLFPKMKLKLKGRLFVTIEEIQAESQRVLDTLTEKDFQEAFQKWRRRWDRCLHAGGTNSRVMASDRLYGEFYDCYSVSPEYFGYTLVY